MESAKQAVPNFLIANEPIKGTYNKLKVIVDELKDLGVLVNENLANFQQELENIHNFCQGNYKFSFFIQGEMNAGKSTSLNVLIGERVTAVSCVPETNFLTCVIPDRGFQTPVLYKIPFAKIYNSQTLSFSVNETDLEFTGISGAENIFESLNKDNQKARDEFREMARKVEEGKESNQNLEKKMKENYKDSVLQDTVYVIKCRIPWLEDKIKDEFVLKRIMFIDFPGMFEYGHKKISEIYKVLENNSQGVIHILHPLGYQSKAVTKLQNYQKYPDRMLIIINKMDLISINQDAEEEENSNSNLQGQEKAEYLVKKFEAFLKQNSESAPDDSQKTKYLEMSKEAKTIINFVTGKEEAMKQYALKYRQTNSQQEKDLWDKILRESIEEDQNYVTELKKAKKKNKPFAEMDLFDDLIESENNLFAKLKDNISGKFVNRFGELVTLDMPKKLNSLRDQLIDMIEKIISQKGPSDAVKEKKEPDNTHSFYSCDGCKADPIVGVRYHCKVCDNFDFCETCKQSKAHDAHDFEVVPKEDLKTYMYEFCTTKILSTIKVIEEFKEYFNVQLMELFFSLGAAFRAGDNIGALETLLKTHFTTYTNLKEQTIAKVQELHQEVAGFVTIIALKWAAKDGPVALISGIEAQKIMSSLFDNYKVTLAFLLTGCAHLLHAIVTSILKKPSQGLVEPAYEGLDILSALVKNPFELDTKVTNNSELASGTAKWQTKFQGFYSGVAGELNEMTKDSIQSLQVMLILDKLIKIVFEDDEKSKEAIEKLDAVLQKLKLIEQL